MTYKAGIITAIQELGDRNGSSSISIKKHMQANLPKEKTWQNATFLAALKNGVEKGEFLKNKNSFKLSADLKKKVKGSSATPQVATKANTVAKETTVKRTISPKKKAFKKKATKQTPVKKKADKETAVKKTTTKKKPAATKEKKTTAEKAEK
jgi:histone H1/5